MRRCLRLCLCSCSHSVRQNACASTTASNGCVQSPRNWCTSFCPSPLLLNFVQWSKHARAHACTDATLQRKIVPVAQCGSRKHTCMHIFIYDARGRQRTVKYGTHGVRVSLDPDIINDAICPVECRLALLPARKTHTHTASKTLRLRHYFNIPLAILLFLRFLACRAYLSES